MLENLLATIFFTVSLSVHVNLGILYIMFLDR